MVFNLYFCFLHIQQENIHGPKIKKKRERVIVGSVSGKKTKPGVTGRGRSEGNRPELIHAEKGQCQAHKAIIWYILTNQRKQQKNIEFSIV